MMQRWHDDFLGELHPRWEVTYGERQHPHLTGNVHIGTQPSSRNFDLEWRYLRVGGDPETANTFIFMDDETDNFALLAMYHNGDIGMTLFQLGGTPPPVSQAHVDQIAGTEFRLEVRGNRFTLFADGQHLFTHLLPTGFSVGNLTVQAWYDNTLEYVSYRDADWAPPSIESWVDEFTDPELHPRWILVDGVYAPPGLTNAVVVGETVADEFDLTLEATRLSWRGEGGAIIIDSDGIAAVSAGVSEDTVTLMVDDVYLYADFIEGPLTLRRSGGWWSVLSGGEVMPTGPGEPEGFLRLPDTKTESLSLTLIAVNATINYAAYGPVGWVPGEASQAIYAGGWIEGIWADGPIKAVYLGGNLLWQSLSSPDPDYWVEDFTSPTMPPGWEPLVPGLGNYDPPGFAGYFVGPPIADDFEIEIDLGDPRPALWVGVFDPTYLGTQEPFQGLGPKVQYGSLGEGVKLYRQFGPVSMDSTVHGDTFMLRKHGTVVTVLQDGEPVPSIRGDILQFDDITGWHNSRIFVVTWEPATGIAGQPWSITAVRYRAL